MGASRSQKIAARMQAENPAPESKDTSIWDTVVSDMKARNEFGLKKYGRELAPHDGRDTLQDIYEELLDACVYIKKMQIERKNGQC